MLMGKCKLPYFSCHSKLEILSGSLYISIGVLLESAYQECLLYELKQAGLKTQKEKPMPIVIKKLNSIMVIE